MSLRSCILEAHGRRLKTVMFDMSAFGMSRPDSISAAIACGDSLRVVIGQGSLIGKLLSNRGHHRALAITIPTQIAHITGPHNAHVTLAALFQRPVCA